MVIVSQFGRFVQHRFLFLSYLDFHGVFQYPFGKGVMYLRIRKILLSVIGGGILAFGLYNVHSLSGVTEGGALGLTLLLEHWLDLSPAWSGLLINFACYAFGFRTLGRSFLCWSALSGGSFSAFYAFLERFPRVWPGLAGMPLPAAFLGALFVGVGVGLCVRAGGAPTGDDALAMSLSQRFHVPIERIYLTTDLTVLALSLTYLPPIRIAYSLLTVTLSGKVIGLIQRWGNS